MIDKFDREFLGSNKKISFIGSGSLGGKAQGLAFINDLIESEFKDNTFSEIEVSIPKLTVIRTDVFDSFMKNNNLYEFAFSEESDDRIAHKFQQAELPFMILGDLRAIVNQVHFPLAVRSSSMLEDAMYEPFAGIYGTKMTPNNQHDADTRFKKLTEAIKFVYASTYFKAAKDYMRATKHKIEDEKMAVIIQKVVGNRYDDIYYPELSGVARSYNFYPMSRSLPEDGVVNLALGLGKTIVDGGVSWVYSPAYPKINPPFASSGDMLKSTQLKFWAVHMGKIPEYNPVEEIEFLSENGLEIADKDGTLKNIASTFNGHSGRVTIGVGSDGPRILTFAPLLIIDDFKFNDLIRKLLSLCEEKLNAPVEIEFAMTFSEERGKAQKPKFGFLQVRPMVVSSEEVSIKKEEFAADDIFTASEKVLGNGSIDSITDIVYVKPEKFEAKYTEQIAGELSLINKKMLQSGSQYLLIGFGRWGSSDPWLGIPVNWGHISGAKVIIEAALENMNVEMSQGSHFFHNMTSFNVLYFSIPFSGEYQIKWDWLSNQKVIDELEFVRHVKLSAPMIIKVDGKRSQGIIKFSGDINE